MKLNEKELDKLNPAYTLDKEKIHVLKMYEFWVAGLHYLHRSGYAEILNGYETLREKATYDWQSIRIAELENQIRNTEIVSEYRKHVYESIDPKLEGQKLRARAVWIAAKCKGQVYKIRLKILADLLSEGRVFAPELF